MAGTKDILRFATIHEFVQKLHLNTPVASPDFLIYDYEKVNHDGFYQLSAYRQCYVEITFNITAGCSIQVDRFDVQPEANRLTIISPYRLQTLQATKKEVNDPYRGYGILFNPEFLQTAPGNGSFTKDFPFFNPHNSPTIALSLCNATYIADLIGKIKYEYEHFGDYSGEIIRSYLQILLLKATKHYSQAISPPVPVSREQAICHEFEWLVKKHFLEIHSVGAYAALLYISPKHLSETVKKVSGRSALQIIHQEKLNHAKSLLRHTGMSVSEIAYELSFENAEYFSVFFKRLTGTSPSQYRIS